jgi:DNA-binding SARP family transcriptional activator/tetratricopeptide (TPR) repeat protein
MAACPEARASGGRLSDTLRGYRLAAGVSQPELALRAGLSVAAVRDLEQGRRLRPRQQSLTRLAGALGLNRRDAEALTAMARVPRAGAAHRPHSPVHSGRLWLQVLGPLSACRGSASVDLGSSRQRCLLALLALRHGALVHRETIIDDLWGNDPPVSAVNLVQSYVSRLRKAIDPGRSPGDPSGRLVSARTSYRLQVGAEELDLLSFEHRCNQARRALAAGNLTAACDFFDAAVKLWRAEPLADLSALRSHPLVTTVYQHHADAVVDFASAAVTAGQAARAMPHLRALTAREPLNERAHAQLMMALIGEGQQAAAMGVYEDIRRRLSRELGTWPGRDLAEAHEYVLHNDVPAARLSIDSRATAAPPHQLPCSVRHFVGRENELRRLDGLLARASGAAGTPSVCVVTGAAGVGKTALGVYWAHQVARHFPDGQLYIDLGGFGPSGLATPPEDAVQGFLDVLRVPADQIPAGLDAKARLYRSLMAGKRVLVLLDNAADEAQISPLLPGSARCLVVVTSRNKLAGLLAAAGPDVVELGAFTEADAVELFRRRLGARRVELESNAAAELITACDRLPLAVAILAGIALTRPGLSLATLGEKLRADGTRLDVLDTGDLRTSIRAVFSWSYQNLRAPSARMFRLLGLHPGPDISVAAAASLARVEPEQARRALIDLAALNMIAEDGGRFVMHDLVRSYAAELADGVDGEPRRRAAALRMLDHYLHSAHAAAAMIDPGRDIISLAGPAPGTKPERPASSGQALNWLQTEHQVLWAIAACASGLGYSTHAWQLPWTLASFQDWRGLWHEAARMQQAALIAARQCGDQAGQVQALRCRGRALMQLGSYAEARLLFQEAMAISAGLGDRIGEARSQGAISWLLEREGNYGEALRHAQQAAELFQSAGHEHGYAYALNSVGWYHAHLGEYEAALSFCERALSLHAGLGDAAGQAASADSVGYTLSCLGRHAEAISRYREALELRASVGDRYLEAGTHSRLGDALHAVGDTSGSRDAWSRALAILQDLDHPDATAVRRKLDPP